MEYHVWMIYLHDGHGAALLDVCGGDVWDMLSYIEDSFGPWADNCVLTVVGA